jgi:hypothetical protein
MAFFHVLPLEKTGANTDENTPLIQVRLTSAKIRSARWNQLLGWAFAPLLVVC